ncbi:MAG: hypothetical protein HUK14_10365 [Muribaculaceae bacterium]|nr:hypothetical protein [Muribaculaceae bacterium]
MILGSGFKLPMVESVVDGASIADSKEKLPTDVVKDVVKEQTEHQAFIYGMANGDVLKDVLITTSNFAEPLSTVERTIQRIQA